MNRVVSIVEKIIAETKDVEWHDPPNVLLVEDEIHDADMAKKALVAMGCAVTIALTGQEALTHLIDTKHPYDILFLDLKLPLRSGVEVLSYVKSYQPKLPVVIVTGLVQNNYMLEEATRLGYFGLIRKPLEEGNLKDIFDQHRISLPRHRKNGVKSAA